MDRIADDIGQPGHVLRQTDAHRQVEYFLGEFDDAFHLRATARQHDAGRDQALVAGPAQLGLHHAEQFLVARLHPFGQRLPREPARRTVADARHLDRFFRVRELRERAGVLHLDFFGVRGRRAETLGDVVRHLVAADRQRSRCGGSRPA